VGAVVAGQICITALQLMRSAVTVPLQVVIFLTALKFIYDTPGKYTNIKVVFIASLTGVVFFS
jgi:hypothetical protein